MSPMDLRANILAAYGVTEEDMAVIDAIEAANGYTAAKAQADAERAAYKADLPFRMASIGAQIMERAKRRHDDSVVDTRA